MSYFDRSSFASGYYNINGKGIITISADMPHDMKVRFWKAWREYRKEIIEREKRGSFLLRISNDPDRGGGPERLAV